MKYPSNTSLTTCGGGAQQFQPPGRYLKWKYNGNCDHPVQQRLIREIVKVDYFIERDKKLNQFEAN